MSVRPNPAGGRVEVVVPRLGAIDPRLKAILIGGGPVPEAVVVDAVARGLPARWTWGLTETSRPSEICGRTVKEAMATSTRETAAEVKKPRLIGAIPLESVLPGLVARSRAPLERPHMVFK